MKINLMTHYAIRTVRNMAQNERMIITSNMISQDEGIPLGVLMKILRRLRLSKIISSHQGRGQLAGGYSLLKSADQITLLNIIEIMEGPVGELFEYKRQSKLGEENCFSKNNLGIEQEYQRLTEIFMREMDRFTIEELVMLKKGNEIQKNRS